MELILINQEKLKIMLSPPDMRHYELDNTPIDPQNNATRRAFRHIFHDAYSRIGFHTQGERLLVQCFASKDGGCEIFVTKLGASSVIDTQTNDTPTSSLTDLPLLITTQTQPVLVTLTSLSNLISLCQRLLSVGYALPSTAYIEDGHPQVIYHLSLTLPCDNLYFLPDVYAFLGEYGEVCEGGGSELYLCEHGRVLCLDDAVERLGEMG